MKLMKTLLATVGLATAAWMAPAAAQDKGTVGISMPTKSSARWIADGDNMVKVLKERGYKTDLQYAEDDIPNQLAQIENMITKGAKVLVIAAIDGTTLSDVLQKAADKGIKVIAYDRLIRGSPNVDYYATFDNFQVGVLQADSRSSTGARPEGRQGPVQHRAVRRLARRQQRLLLLRRRDVGAAALHRQRQAGRAQQADGHGQGRHAALGRRRRPGAHGQPAVAPTTARTRSTPCCRPMTACRIGILSSLKGVGYGTRATADAGRHRPGRRSAVGQVDPRRRAVLDHLQGHARTRQGHRRHGRRRAQRQGSPRSTTPRPTTTASRWCRPTCSSRSPSTSRNWKKVLIDSGYYKRVADQVSAVEAAASRPPGHGTLALRATIRLHQRTGMDDTILEMRGITQDAFPAWTRWTNVNLTRARRRDPRPGRRERRRQVDADEGALSGVYPHGTYDGEILFEARSGASATSPTASSSASSSSTRSWRWCRCCRSPRTSSSATSRRRTA